MEYRKLGSSDVTISAVTFGAWAAGGMMWGGTDENDVITAIRRAHELGVTSIDTAPIYGYGLSEELVAKAIAGLPRDRVQILTKFGLRWDLEGGEYFFDWEQEGFGSRKIYRNARKESVMEECETSLQRLGTDYLDLYQCHWRDHTTPVEETMEALGRLMEQGKIRAAGVSNFRAAEIDACRKVIPLASDQPPYSMLKRGIEKKLVPYCIENNVGLIVYSPLQKGLLTGKVTEGRTFAEGDHRANDPDFEPANIRRVSAFLEKIRPIAESRGATLSQLVIAWTIQRPGVTAALVGARNSAQAEENAKAGEIRLTLEETESIDGIIEELC